MSSTHQHKRPYAGSQPSITSYFPTSSQPSYSIASQTSSETQSPDLPASVQSNLLSVGMRVRKAVPEGYKTGSYSAFTLFSDTLVPAVATEVPSPQRTTMRPRARELTPFCGLMKVGGLAQQSWSINTDEEIEDDDQDYLPALSQGSTVSGVSTASFSRSRANKRRFDMEDEDTEDTEDTGDRGGMARRMLEFGERAIAVPKRMRRFDEKNVMVAGQENVRNGDFEDAEFLDYGLLDGGEVEMGGV